MSGQRSGCPFQATPRTQRKTKKPQKEPAFETAQEKSPRFFHFSGSTLMEDYYYSRNHVPAFGSWDWNSDLPFTQCFESARQAGLLRYSYSEDRDLYVAGDLYENDVVTPAVIVVPRRRAKVRHARAKEEKKHRSWAVNGVKEPPSPSGSPMPRPTPKPVDEDLYKIPPELLYAKPKKKRGLGFLHGCLLPSCVP